MAICNNCGFDNSDENKFCRECGTKLVEELEENQTNLDSDENEKLATEEITADTNIELHATPKKDKKRFIIISVLILVIAIGGYLAYQKYVEAQYENKMKQVVSEILDQSVKCESMIGTFSKVWDETISNDYFSKPIINGERPNDFNDAIRLQMAEFGNNGQYGEVRDGKTQIDNMVIELKNPPSKYLTEYNLIVEFYTTYCEYQSLAVTPQGSLLSFNNKTSDLSSQIVKKINEFKVRIPL